MIDKDSKIVIIGFGFSGLAFLASFVKNCTASSITDIDIFEKSDNLARGLAYSTNDLDHLLNVPAYKMSIFEDTPDDLMQWFLQNGYNYDKNAFIPRLIYGQYLESVFNDTLNLAKRKNITINIYHKEIKNIEKVNNGFIIFETFYNKVIYTCGNFAKQIPNTISCFHEKAITSIMSKDVMIFGTGLSMIDVCLTLNKNIHIKNITAISRNAKLQSIHKPEYFDIKIDPTITLNDVKNLKLSDIIHKFRISLNKHEDWRIGFDSIRPISQNLWMGLDMKDKKKFLTKILSFYSKCRHRIPPMQMGVINRMLENGKLKIMKGNYKDFIKLEIPKINCLGIEMNVKKIQNELLHNLISNNILKIHETNFGISSNITNFHVISPLLIGELGEIIAVPELRKQVRL